MYLSELQHTGPLASRVPSGHRAHEPCPGSGDSATAEQSARMAENNGCQQSGSRRGESRDDVLVLSCLGEISRSSLTTFSGQEARHPGSGRICESRASPTGELSGLPRCCVPYAWLWCRNCTSSSPPVSEESSVLSEDSVLRRAPVCGVSAAPVYAQHPRVPPKEGAYDIEHLAKPG